MSAAVAEIVQTFAQAPDLFGDAAPARLKLTFTGRLAEKPQVKNVALGDGQFVPALVLELSDVGAGHHQVRAHVLFPRDRHDQAQAQADRLKRGQRVSVSTDLADVRVHLPAASLSTETP